MKTIAILSALLLATFSFGHVSAAEVSSESCIFAAQKKKAETKEVTFKVHLHCKNCVNKVVENISYEKGVKGLDVSLEKQTVYIKYDPAKTSEEKLKAAVEALGYPVLGKADCCCKGGECKDGECTGDAHHHDGECHDEDCKDTHHNEKH